MKWALFGKRIIHGRFRILHNFALWHPLQGFQFIFNNALHKVVITHPLSAININHSQKKLSAL
jgi:hypothetical protein